MEDIPLNKTSPARITEEQTSNQVRNLTSPINTREDIQSSKPNKDDRLIKYEYLRTNTQRASSITISILITICTIMMGIFTLRSSDADMFCNTIFFLAILSISVYLVAREYRDRDLKMIIFNDKLVYHQNGKVVSYLWDEIDYVWKKIRNINIDSETTIHRFHKYIIQLVDGNTLILDDQISNITELGDIIQRETARHLFPRAISIINNGGAIHFGRISIDKRSIHVGLDSYLWEAIENVRVDEDSIMINIWGDGNNYIIGRVNETPNIIMLLEIAKYIISSS